MEIKIVESIKIPAWTSRSLKAVGVENCPSAKAVKCTYRFYDSIGRGLHCRCALRGDECFVLLAGQKFYLKEVR